MKNNDSLNRIRLLRIWEILQRETDEEHPMGTETLREKLLEGGIECHRSTLYEDIKLLNESGYEILTELHSKKDYHCSVVLLLINRTLLNDNNIRFLESAYCSEDMLFTYKIFCSSIKTAQCKNTLYHRRYRSCSIVTSKKSERHFRSCRDVYEEIRTYSEKIGKTGDYMATEYTVRCAFNALNTYKKISKKDQSLCKNEYKSLKKDILSHSAFGNKSLKMRCYGKAFWFIYKIFDKTVGRLLKGIK